MASIRPNGGAGHMAYDILVTNTSSSSCVLPGKKPEFYGKASTTGTVVAIPTSINGTSPGPLTLASGEQAMTSLYMINGYGGYDPSSPACANPVVYQNLSIKMGDGSHLALSGLTVDLKCDGITTYYWSRVASS